MLFQHKRLLYNNELILVRLTSLTSLNLTQYNILIHMHLYHNSEVEVKKINTEKVEHVNKII